VTVIADAEDSKAPDSATIRTIAKLRKTNSYVCSISPSHRITHLSIRGSGFELSGALDLGSIRICFEAQALRNVCDPILAEM
jgi:hypothetical protein